MTQPQKKEWLPRTFLFAIVYKCGADIKMLQVIAVDALMALIIFTNDGHTIESVKSVTTIGKVDWMKDILIESINICTILNSKSRLSCDDSGKTPFNNVVECKLPESQKCDYRKNAILKIQVEE